MNERETAISLSDTAPLVCGKRKRLESFALPLFLIKEFSNLSQASIS